MRPLLLKLGGELIENADDRSRIARFVKETSAQRGVAVVHGGGRAIDAELTRRAIAPRKVEGLRVTDEATLDVVVSVLGGSANTALVAAFVSENVPAVGLTGVDAGMGRAVRASAHRATSGTIVDLGLVGDPIDADPTLVRLLIAHRYVPVMASLGLEVADDSSAAPRVLNVNADVLACRLAAALVDCDLVIAGGTPGVLDDQGASISELDSEGIDRMIASGTATAGMVAKLAACQTALDAGVSSVRIIDGKRLDAGQGVERAPGTRLVTTARSVYS